MTIGEVKLNKCKACKIDDDNKIYPCLRYCTNNIQRVKGKEAVCLSVNQNNAKNRAARVFVCAQRSAQFIE